MEVVVQGMEGYQAPMEVVGGIAVGLAGQLQEGTWAVPALVRLSPSRSR